MSAMNVFMEFRENQKAFFKKKPIICSWMMLVALAEKRWASLGQS
jgi:hypothetical protein